LGAWQERHCRSAGTTISGSFCKKNARFFDEGDDDLSGTFEKCKEPLKRITNARRVNTETQRIKTTNYSYG
jgi:hypothetical protein